MDRMDMFPTNSQDSGNPDVSPGSDEVLGSPENLPGSMTSESPILTPEHNEASGSPDITPSEASRSSNMFFGSGSVSANLMISRGSRRISESPDMSPAYNNSTPNGTPMYRNNSGRYSMSSVGSNSPNSPDTSSISTDTPATPISILSRTIKQSRKVFIGTYLERRYVRSIQAYRDIIVVDKNEQELFKCLNEVREVVAQQYGTDKWLGLTYDMKDSVVQSYKIWVELERVPLGRHWFQLRSIKVQGHAVQLQLKYLRMFQTTERESLNVIEYPSINYRELFTYDNVCGALRFSAVLFMSVLTLICHALWYFGDYSIKFTHELSGLIHALTPFGFAVINFCSKCVAGFYWLVYMLWKGNSVPRIDNYGGRIPIGYNNN